MARALATLALLWPLAQAATVAATIRGTDGVASAMVRLVGSRVCHQRPERSFHTAGVQWPVCARCSGLYVGAAIGAWLAFVASFRRRMRGSSAAFLLMLLSVPTATTWLAEWLLGVPVANGVRAAAALPLGAAVAATIVAVASPSPKNNQVN